MKVTKLQTLLTIAISGFIGYYLGTTEVTVAWRNYQPNVTVINKEPPSASATVDFSLFWNVWNKLNATYYDKQSLDGKKLLYGAISGMVQSVGDPYTLFLPPSQNNSFQQQLAGQFGGIGAELGLDNKQIIIISPLDDSPAQKAGIKAGDAILKVDGQSTVGLSLAQAVEKIRGPKGTKVTLTIQHKNEKEQKDIPIVRDTIKIKSVSGWVKKIKDVDYISNQLKKSPNADSAVMYLRLSQFGDSTNQDWIALVGKLHTEMQKYQNAKGVIFDLRRNPGGYLTDATFIAGEFLSENTPVVIEDKGNGDTTTLSVTRKGMLVDTPVVVLIDKGSASASEIVAAALSENRKIKLVGETSFGKGTVQEATDLGGGAGVHITVAKWETPGGNWIHKKGLTPDDQVSLNEKDPNHDTQLEKAIEELVK